MTIDGQNLDKYSLYGCLNTNILICDKFASCHKFTIIYSCPSLVIF